MPVTTVKCPTCQKAVKWQPESEFRPFCSDRCRLIDLGEWANEEKAIPGQPVPTFVDSDSANDDW